MTNNQLVSAFVGMVMLLLFWFGDKFAGSVTATTESVLEFFSPRTHFTNFVRGIIDTESVIYLLALTAIFLFLAVRSLESRRWR